MLYSVIWDKSVSPSLERVVDNINCGNGLATLRTVHNVSFNFVAQFFVPCMSNVTFFFIFQQVVSNVNFQFLILILVDTSVWDVQIRTITCTYNIVDVCKEDVPCFNSCCIVFVKQTIPYCLVNLFYPYLPMLIKSFTALFFICSCKCNYCTHYALSFRCLCFSVPLKQTIRQYLHDISKFQRTSTWIVHSCISAQHKVGKAILFWIF